MHSFKVGTKFFLEGYWILGADITQMSPRRPGMDVGLVWGGEPADVEELLDGRVVAIFLGLPERAFEWKFVVYFVIAKAIVVELIPRLRLHRGATKLETFEKVFPMIVNDLPPVFGLEIFGHHSPHNENERAGLNPPVPLLIAEQFAVLVIQGA
jgi:hypothetical protein